MTDGIIAKNITVLRKQKNLTQGELAAHIHYSDKVISKWERGESTPDINALVALAAFYGVSLDYLAGVDLAKGNAFKADGESAEFKTEKSEEQLSNRSEQNAEQQSKQNAKQKTEQKTMAKVQIEWALRIAALIVLPMLTNMVYLIQNELFTVKFLSSQFYFLSVIPAVLFANLVISLILQRRLSQNGLLLLFATVWTAGLIVIYNLWNLGIVAPDSQRMRIWYVLLFYNIIVAAIVTATLAVIKRRKKTLG